VNGNSLYDASVRPLPRRQRDRLQRRADLLRAAEQVFAAKGFHAASMEEIARVGEYGTGTVYLYFKDKQALYIELFEQKIRELSGYMAQQVGRESEPLAALKRLIQARMEYFEHNRAFFQVYAREGMDMAFGRQAEWRAVRRLFAENLAFLARLISAGQRRKLLRAGDARQMAVALSGMMIQITRDWLRSRGERPLTEQVELVLELFLRGAEQR